MEIEVEAAMTSCGYAVPRFDRLEERDTLRKYWQTRGDDAVVKYHGDKNLESIDGSEWRHRIRSPPTPLLVQGGVA